MKMLTATRVAALAVGLSLVGTQAFAAPPDSRGRGNDDSTTSQGVKDRGDRDHRKGRQTPPIANNQPPAVAPIVQPNPQARGRQDRVAPRNRDERRATDNRRGRNDQANDRRNDNRNLRNDRRRDQSNDNDRRRDYGNNNDRRNWDKQDRRRKVDVARYNRNFNAPRRYRVEQYRGVRGYSYRRYSYGQRLPRSYYGRNFWLSNFVIYGLFPPPPGYVWVRYGPDALLIDEYTGEIVQVQYGLFYS